MCSLFLFIKILKQLNFFFVIQVQTGFGRTGKYWGFQNHGVVPDIGKIEKYFEVCILLK